MSWKAEHVSTLFSHTYLPLLPLLSCLPCLPLLIPAPCLLPHLNSPPSPTQGSGTIVQPALPTQCQEAFKSSLRMVGIVMGRIFLLVCLLHSSLSYKLTYAFPQRSYPLQTVYCTTWLGIAPGGGSNMMPSSFRHQTWSGALGSTAQPHPFSSEWMEPLAATTQFRGHNCTIPTPPTLHAFQYWTQTHIPLFTCSNVAFARTM